MTVDLSKLKPGDTVVHRNGGRSVVTNMKVNHYHSYQVELSFGENNEGIKYTNEGLFFDWREHPFDIIAIEPAAEKKTPLDEWWQDVCDHILEGAKIGDLISLAQAINQTLKDMEKK